MDMPVQDTKKLVYKSSEQPTTLFKNLSGLGNELCDVFLQAEDTKLPAHRIVLAASSPYFKAMFTGNMLESNMGCITLKGISLVGLRAVLNFIYTAKVELDYTSIQYVLEAASHLQIFHLTEICCKFLMTNIDYSTYQMVFETSVTHGFRQCETRAVEFACSNYLTIIKNQSYLSLSCESQAAILSRSKIEKCSEFELFKCALHWLEHKGLDQDYKTAIKLLNEIRFHTVPINDYRDKFLPLLQAKQTNCDPLNCPWANTIERIENYHTHILAQPSLSLLLPALRNTSDKLAVIGGKRMSFNSVYSDVVQVRGTKDVLWSQLTMYPGPGISHSGVAMVGHFLYIVGGQCEGEACNIVHRYDTTQSRWCAGVAPLNTPREYFHLSAVNGKLYAIAGRNSWRQCLPTSECYDPTTNTWCDISSLHVSIACHAGTSTKDTVWICGGVSNGGVYQNHMLSYDTKQELWRANSPAKIKRVWHCMEALGQQIYVFGGNECNASMDRVHSTSTEVYGIKTGQWTTVQRVLCGVIEASSAVWQGRIYLLGGYSQLRENAVPTIQVYDPTNNKWQEDGSPLNEPVRGTSSCVLQLRDEPI